MCTVLVSQRSREGDVLFESRSCTFTTKIVRINRVQYDNVLASVVIVGHPLRGGLSSHYIGDIGEDSIAIGQPDGQPDARKGSRMLIEPTMA